jgi:chromosome segregation ATPase
LQIGRINFSFYNYRNILRCETIRAEYERLLSLKNTELEELKAQIDELNTEMNSLKETNRKQIDQRDTEINCLRLNNDSARLELCQAQSELQQLKTRFESLRSKEKENQLAYSKTLDELEASNEKLNNKCLDFSKDLTDAQVKHDSVKCQLAKYEQLIDNLNEQIVLLKRELKESQLDLNRLGGNYDLECELKAKLDTKCQEMTKEMLDLKEISIRHEKCESLMADLSVKLKQSETVINKK